MPRFRQRTSFDPSSVFELPDFVRVNLGIGPAVVGTPQKVSSCPDLQTESFAVFIRKFPLIFLHPNFSGDFVNVGEVVFRGENDVPFGLGVDPDRVGRGGKGPAIGDDVLGGETLIRVIVEIRRLSGGRSPEDEDCGGGQRDGRVFASLRG